MWHQDEKIVEMEHGYRQYALGDSGSGYFLDQDTEEGTPISGVSHLKRATIVAVLSGGALIFTPKTKGMKCRGYATKLTDEIINWIKEKDPIDR